MSGHLDNVIAVIPARAGSKGLPGKNIRTLAGAPLYYHSVAAAQAAGIRNVLVSTDIESIFHDSEKRGGFRVLRRPESLCTDSATMGQVLKDVISTEVKVPSTIVLLQPTSPLRQHMQIIEALELFREGNFSLVLSVTEVSNSSLKFGMIENGRFQAVSKGKYCFSNRQALPNLYRPNGAVYVFSSEMFRESEEFDTINIGAVCMPEQDSYDIDNLNDFKQCEFLLSSRRGS
ncbi:cytidylyltransferase domain-containing protein [Pseudovibrio ascidiaceicola]|uniref:acylneuraminate cytidylyltransferase family protein n=1 Tax=Pseudovibrio ascidiaceicola TaxID=285279 RepID=UPI000D6854EA|nr:acylneuraminate cytidylyltransferase family protein [Pseudovibrio ascidiaceicola]